MFWPDLRLISKSSTQRRGVTYLWICCVAILLAGMAALFNLGARSASADDKLEDDAHERDGYAIGLWVTCRTRTCKRRLVLPI